jgi:hypothetical protein
LGRVEIISSTALQAMKVLSGDARVDQHFLALNVGRKLKRPVTSFLEVLDSCLVHPHI